LVICGPKGAGQQYIGSAVLNHLEGYHIQSLDLANLISDSTTSADARCVQIFTEAKRHKPSLLYIPSLHHWQSSPILEGVTKTVTSLLDELKASDPILLLAIADCPFTDLPREIRSWFGISRTSRVLLTYPDEAQRSEFFADTLANIRRPPTEFPDALPRKKRVLEVLPKAPPREPRKPTESELQSQLAHDQKLVEYLKFRLGPVLSELKKKHKRFTKPINPPPPQPLQSQADDEEISVIPQYYDVDLEKMHYKLYYNEYLTSQQFVADVQKIVYNAEQEHRRSLTEDHETVVKAQAMLTHTRVMVEQACDPQFDIDCHRMYERMKLRNPLLGQPKKRATPKEKAQPLPERQSHRVCGLEPEIPYDPHFSDRGVKRMMGGYDAHTDPERPTKRNKGGPPHHQPSSSGSVKDCEERVVDENGRAAEGTPEDPTSLAQAGDLPASTTPDYEPECLKSTDLSSAPISLATHHPCSADKAPHTNGLHQPAASAVADGDCSMQTAAESIPGQQPNGSSGKEMVSGSSEKAAPGLEGCDEGATGETECPPVVYPDFECPEEPLSSLRLELVHKTHGLSLDHLELLRAGCCNIIWANRAAFQRASMLAQCRHFVHQFFQDLALVLSDADRDPLSPDLHPY